MAGVIVEEGRAVPEQEPVRVLIVDDDPLVRASLRHAMGGTPELAVVGETGDSSAALDAVRALSPQVVLLDLGMPALDGRTTTERLRGQAGAPEVIVLTAFGADEQVLAALRAGAAGFLLTDTARERVVTAVRQVASGEPMLPAGVTRRLIDFAAPRGRPARRERAQQALARLTPREREVAIEVAEARRTAEIAAHLQLPAASAEAVLGRALAKLDLNNRVQLALLVHDAED
jgi:DNA-binding NarL/FixJ family response regulator